MEQHSGEITPSCESHLALNYNKLDPYTNGISCLVTTPIKTESESLASIKRRKDASAYR